VTFEESAARDLLARVLARSWRFAPFRKENTVLISVHIIMAGNDETNEIALLALRQVGCNLPEDFGGIEAFTTDTLVRSLPLVYCPFQCLSQRVGLTVRC